MLHAMAAAAMSGHGPGCDGAMAFRAGLFSLLVVSEGMAHPSCAASVSAFRDRGIDMSRVTCHKLSFLDVDLETRVAEYVNE